MFRLNFIAALGAAFLLTFLSSGCGIKGPLVLPHKTPAAQHATAASHSKASAVKPENSSQPQTPSQPAAQSTGEEAK